MKNSKFLSKKNNAQCPRSSANPKQDKYRKTPHFWRSTGIWSNELHYNSFEGSLYILTSVFHCGCYGDFLFFHICMYSPTNKSPLTLVCIFSRSKAHHWAQFTLNKEFFSFLSNHDDCKSVMSIRAAASPLGLLCRNRKSHIFPRADAVLNQDTGLSEQSTVWFSDALAAWLQDSCSVNKL